MRGLKAKAKKISIAPMIASLDTETLNGVQTIGILKKICV